MRRGGAGGGGGEGHGLRAAARVADRRKAKYGAVHAAAGCSRGGMGGVPWSESEDAALRAAVGRNGMAWVSLVSRFPGRTADALRRRWSDISGGEVGGPVETVEFPVGCFDSCEGGPIEVLATTAGRSVHGGRPWDYVIRRSARWGSCIRSRAPTDRQLRLVRNWQLDITGNGCDLLLCNLKRAEEKLRKHMLACGVLPGELNERVLCCPIPRWKRDTLGMVLYPGEVGATVTTSCAPYNWVGGPAAGDGRFATAVEVAGFMGIDSRGGPFRVASRVYTDFQLCGVLAESVHSRVADLAVRLVTSRCGTSLSLAVGSMYSGAFDELGAAWRRACPLAFCSFVAESDLDKLGVLTHAMAPRRAYRCVSEIDGCYPANVLVISPPCLVYSKANRLSTAADGRQAALEQTREMERVIGLLLPDVVVVEQTHGLLTHYPLAYRLFCDVWDGLPYKVLHSPIDAHTDCEGSHHRLRLIWVAMRCP